tara:strand:- start:589 stop:930 length:342 start_codon:yes stop_codon:yes gene_type:complete
MITRDGRTKMRDLLISNFTKYKVGAGGDSTNPNSSDLDSPLISLASMNTPTISGETSIDFTFTVLGSSLVGQTLKEAGVFTASGELLVRVNFDPIGPLTATDEIDFIITVEVD